MFELKTIKALKWITKILSRHNVLYQVSGGFASKLYGSERLLNDIDIDIPEERFAEVENEVKQYIINGPIDLNDGKWDLKIMTLNFEGQTIDIGGAFGAKVSNKNRNKWIPIPVDFSKIRKITVGGVTVNVVSPEDLIKYKVHLDGAHQVEDIKAVKEYLQSERRN